MHASAGMSADLSCGMLPEASVLGCCLRLQHANCKMVALAHTLSAQCLLRVDLTAVHLMLALPCRYVFRTCQVTQCAQGEPVSQCMQDATSDAAPVWLPTCVMPATVSLPANNECPSV